ncbi:transcriptional regulator [Nisaea sp.]|uniref:transcriptional regulator n=1 Tax=Nisaea sp. TaxID=2024842 RepID=UPI003B52E50F
MFAGKLLKAIVFSCLLAATCWPGSVRAETQLLMVEQEGCEWCDAWNREIGEVYHKTDEGKRAPLRRQDLFAAWPDDVTIRGQIHFTPTFILLVDGREAGRIEGYPGENFFWPLLAQLLNRTPRGPDTKEGNGS